MLWKSVKIHKQKAKRTNVGRNSSIRSKLWVVLFHFRAIFRAGIRKGHDGVTLFDTSLWKRCYCGNTSSWHICLSAEMHFMNVRCRADVIHTGTFFGSGATCDVCTSDSIDTSRYSIRDMFAVFPDDLIESALHFTSCLTQCSLDQPHRECNCASFMNHFVADRWCVLRCIYSRMIDHCDSCDRGPPTADHAPLKNAK